MNDFVHEAKDMSAVEVLNYYRNLYYAEPQNTERGLVANAINEVMVGMDQSNHGGMRVETVGRGGYYRKYYFCPACGLEIGDKTFDINGQIGQGTVLRSNQFPNHCPYCGKKLMDGQR